MKIKINVNERINTGVELNKVNQIKRLDRKIKY
jgi:hypothetical protein